MSITKIRQFQLNQTSLSQITLKLVVSTVLTEIEHNNVVQLIRTKLGFDFDIDVIYADAIAREASGKYEEFKSTLSDPTHEVT